MRIERECRASPILPAPALITPHPLCPPLPSGGGRDAGLNELWETAVDHCSGRLFRLLLVVLFEVIRDAVL